MKLKLNDISKAVKLTAGKLKLKGKQHSPEILMVTGIVTGVATVVVACKSTLKAPEIVAETKKTVDAIHEATESEEITAEQYSEEDRKKDLTIVYVQTTVKFIKLYAPALILGAVSLTSVLASQNILKTRNAALASAYAIVDKSFKDYRGRVVERFGEKVDDELRYNIKAKNFDRIEVNEDGEAITKRDSAEVVDNSTVDNEFTKWFDESCTGWDRDPDVSRLFLITQQKYLNDRLQANGHLFLNEVYDCLGYPRTVIGQQMGWIYDPSDPNHANYVDFGLTTKHREANQDFINGYEKYALLTFNFDGPILNCLKQK